MAWPGGDMDVRRLGRTERAFLSLGILWTVAGCSPILRGTTPDQIFPVGKSGVCAQSQLQNRFVVRWKDQHISVESAANRDEFIKSFLNQRLDQIEFVEYDHRVALPTQPVHALDHVPPTNSWGQTIVKASAAWSRNILGQGITVAVIDTGVDVSHKQLRGQIAINLAEQNGLPGVDDDKNGYVDDINGWNFVDQKPLTDDNQYHGTHVSGVIAANPDAGSIQGMAPSARIMPLAFLANDGSGNIGDAVLAIQYAVARGARVINASWGGSVCSVNLKNTVLSLAQSGVLFIAAAGNDRNNLDFTPSFPASFTADGAATQLTVGASGWADALASFSNFSTTAVQLVAPGMSIVSTVPGDSTMTLDGTSMATPFVTGAVALLLSDRPKASAQDIKDAILNSVFQNNFPVQSRGRLDVAAALSYLEAHVAP